MNKERTNPCCVGLRIQEKIRTRLHLVPAIQGFARTPPAGRDDLSIYFNDIIRTVCDELSVDTEDLFDARFDLLRRVVTNTKTSGRVRDQPSKLRNILMSGDSDYHGTSYSVHVVVHTSFAAEHRTMRHHAYHTGTRQHHARHVDR